MFILMLAGLHPALYSQSVMSYNIRYDNPGDGINTWDNRKDWLSRQITELNPGIIGIQEALHNQVSYLDSTLSQFTYVGVGRDDGKQSGEYSPVFVDTMQYELLETDTFWLSENPEQPSVGWDAALERICTWVKIRSRKSGQRYLVMNTHFDHRGAIARLRSAELITRMISSLNRSGEPVILTGDFNALPDSDVISHLNSILNDAREVSTMKAEGPVGTFNGFDVNHPLNDRIDYIFVSDDLRVADYSVILDIKENRTPSDHLPVLIRINAGQ